MPLTDGSRSGSDANALLALQRGLTGDRTLAGKAYMDDPALLAAYSQYYYEVSKAQVIRACSVSGIRPSSALDLGSGPGSVSVALAGLGARSFTLVDSSARALELAADNIARTQSSTGAPSARTIVADLESAEAFPRGPYDLVSFGHCLNEIGSGDGRIARRLSIVRRAADVLAPGGAVMIIEPATLASSRDNLALRDSLVAEGWTVRAPCAYSGPCPALLAGASHTCHDESGWAVPDRVRRLATEAGLDRDLIKMSWFFISPPASRISPTSSCISPPDAAYRVVSAPMLNKGGRVRYLICGPQGRFPFSAKKGDDAASAAGFFDLKRYDLIRVGAPELREGGWGFGSATTIRLL